MRLAVCLVILGTVMPSPGHPLAPSLLALRERDDGRVDVEWKTPVASVPGTSASPRLPPGCREVSPRERSADGVGVRTRWAVACEAATLVGQRIGLEGAGPAGVVVRIVFRDGRVVERLVQDSDPWFTIPDAQTRWEALRAYVSLGVQHLLGGPDHLLFVFGLVLLGGSFRRVAAVVTAFTLGHSVTLAAAVLGIVALPQPPIELAIAASVFVLAVELARDPAVASLVRRRPWVIAALFGLLHGLGFAAALIDAGLPPDSVPAALVGFNVGIELGQIVFVATVLALWPLGSRVVRRLPSWGNRIAVYAMGTLAAFWMLQRTLALVR